MHPGTMTQEQLIKQTLILRKELADQWLTNHSEHCGVSVPPWPHKGDCHWPLPAILASMSPSEVYLLLLLVSEESVGLHL
jgi:hypothetical protein